MAATETTEAAAAARDATRLESPVCFFLFCLFFITLILFLDPLTTSKQQQQQQQRLETQRDASRAAGILIYLRKEGSRRSYQVCFFLILVFFLLY
jgi:hypothetical protein